MPGTQRSFCLASIVSPPQADSLRCPSAHWRPVALVWANACSWQTRHVCWCCPPSWGGCSGLLAVQRPGLGCKLLVMVSHWALGPRSLLALSSEPLGSWTHLSPVITPHPYPGARHPALLLSERWVWTCPWESWRSEEERKRGGVHAQTRASQPVVQLNAEPTPPCCPLGALGDAAEPMVHTLLPSFCVPLRAPVYNS